MPKQYRVGAMTRFNNTVMRSLIKSGVRIGTFAILTVPGRNSGRPIHTPLVVFRYGENRYLVASYGVVNWVRNIRATDGRATLSRAQHSEEITANELPPYEAAPILRYSLQTGPPGIPRLVVRVYRRFFVLPYLDVDINSPAEDFQRSAQSHPVFLLKPAI
jgi:deazaflavin-dependent oxidoreductase (nitroreductase family)